MSKSTRTFGQFIVNEEGINTVTGLQYRYVNKEYIIRGNYQPARNMLKLDWVSKNDFCRAYKYAEKIFCQNENTVSNLNSEQQARILDEFKELPWKKNKKGNHVAVTEQGDTITVFKDPMNLDKLKWVSGDIFSHSSYKRLDKAKMDAFKHYCLSKRSGK